MKKILTVLMIAASALLSLKAAVPEKVKPVKNVILMITDGTSSPLLSITRYYQQYQDPSRTNLNIDPYLCGYVRTASANESITASSAAMSAYTTGHRTDNPCIAVAPKGQQYNPMATFFEVAKNEQNKSVGLVATCFFMHATPAACLSHGEKRYAENDLKWQIAANAPDVVFSGGADAIDDHIMEMLKRQGASLYVNDVEGFRKHNGPGKVWSVWAEGNMDFEIDRKDSEEPSLAEMTSKAIDILSRDKDGFCLMVEGSKVDYAMHSNDPATSIREFIAFDEALGVALDFAKKDGSTLVVVLTDHGTGGINCDGTKKGEDPFGRGLFGDIDKIKVSYSKAAELLEGCPVDELRGRFQEVTGLELTDRQYENLVSTIEVKEDDYMKVGYSRNLLSTITEIYRSNCSIRYIGGGHTIEDVFLAVYHPKGNIPTGFLHNYEIAEYISRALGFKKPMDAYSGDYFVSHKEAFNESECTLDSSDERPVLTVRKNGKTLKVSAYDDRVELNGKAVSVKVPTVFIRKTGTMYMPREIVNLMK